MPQISVLHTLRAKSVARDFVRGLNEAGIDAPWDEEGHGSMAYEASGPTNCSVVLWTRDAPISRWLHQHAEDAYRRGVLVEVMLEKMAQPFDSAIPPIDFVEVDGDHRKAGRLWRELRKRIRSTLRK